MLQGLDPTNIPDEFFCPISLDLMEDPVTAADGHSYERREIEAWFGGGHNTSPKTGAVLPNTNLVPNIPLRNLIREYRERRTQAAAAATVATVANTEESQRERELRAQVQQVQQEKQCLCQQLASSCRFFNSLPLPEHEEVMQKLAKDLGVQYEEVYHGVAVEQTLVGFAGIYTDQTGAIYRRNSDGTTSFRLHLVNEQEYQNFIRFYQEHFANFVVSHQNVSEGQYRITVNSRLLCNQVSLALGHFRAEGHRELMQKFAADLGVSWNDVYTGSAVEQTLVRMAGIETEQSHAFYRRNDTKQSTCFNLSFASEEDYRRFNEYYNGHFAGLIFNTHYEHQGLSRIEMNTNILQTQVSTALGEFARHLAESNVRH
jgi:hypothetical protein